MERIWLHRINAGANISYTLLQHGYLSVGYSCFLEDKTKNDTLKLLRSDINRADRERLFEDICASNGLAKYKGRWSLWRFLFDFAEGDMVLVPGSGAFQQCFIDGPAQAVSCIPADVIPERGGDGSPIMSKKGILCNADTGQAYDIGFVRRVRRETERWVERDRANAFLANRLKIRCTTADISDLGEAVKGAMTATGPVDFRQYALTQFSSGMVELLREHVQADALESLIRWYFNRIGASDVSIPAKNERGKVAEDESDADIIATFENLQTIIYVQAKKHWNITDSWAVTQVSNYVERERGGIEKDGYTRIAWVISTCDDFDQIAKNQAGIDSVRLVNGEEFARMLFDAGFYGMRM